MGELHELAHDPTGGHAHVDHGDALADELSAADAEEKGTAVTLHVLLHFAHCCGQSTTSIPALQVVNCMPTAERPFRSEGRRVGHECVSTCRSRWSPVR